MQSFFCKIQLNTYTLNNTAILNFRQLFSDLLIYSRIENKEIVKAKMKSSALELTKERLKKGKNMVFDHNWGGGGVSPNHTLIIFENIIYIFNYTQFVVIPKKKVTFIHLKHYLVEIEGLTSWFHCLPIDF